MKKKETLMKYSDEEIKKVLVRFSELLVIAVTTLAVLTYVGYHIL